MLKLVKKKTGKNSLTLVKEEIEKKEAEKSLQKELRLLVEKRIKITNRWGLGRFSAFQKFWVQDTKLLHMVQLYLGKKILKVETYKLRRELESEDTDNTKNP